MPAVGGEELVSRVGSATFGGRVDVGVVPVDVTTVGEAAHEHDRTVTKRLRTRIPPLRLHGQKRRVVEPLAVGGGEVVFARARVQDTDTLGTVVVAESGVVNALEGVVGSSLVTDVTTGADSSVTAEGGEGAVGQVHARRAENVSGDAHGLGCAGGDVVNGTHRGEVAELRRVVF